MNTEQTSKNIFMYITFSAEQISHMLFIYVQDVYHKNQLGT